MATTVDERAHRCLRHLTSYQTTTVMPGDCAHVPLEIDERLIGIYRNPPDPIEGDMSVVLVTDRRLIVSSKKDLHYVIYLYIEYIDSPPKSGSLNGQIIVRLIDGSVAAVPIMGTHGRFQDVWDVVRFLLRVVEDLTGRVPISR